MTYERLRTSALLLSLALIACPTSPPPEPSIQITGVRDIEVGEQLSLALVVPGTPSGHARWSIEAASHEAHAVFADTSDTGASLVGIRAGEVYIEARWVDEEGTNPEVTDSEALTITARQTSPPNIPGPTCSTSAPPFEATMLEQAGGLVCGAPHALTRGDEGAVAGLARGPGGEVLEIDERAVTACLLVDFDRVLTAVQLRVVAQSVPDICGDACVDDYCDTGRHVLTYGSSDGSTFTYLGPVNVNEQLEAYVVDIDSSAASLRYALVCRSGDGHGRDNIGLDYVELCI